MLIYKILFDIHYKKKSKIKNYKIIQTYFGVLGPVASSFFREVLLVGARPGHLLAADETHFPKEIYSLPSIFPDNTKTNNSKVTVSL